MYLLGVTDAAVGRFGLRHATVLLLKHFLIHLLHSGQLILKLVYACLLSLDYILLLFRHFSLVVELTLQLNEVISVFFLSKLLKFLLLRFLDGF
jgi:hypothetical protein